MSFNSTPYRNHGIWVNGTEMETQTQEQIVILSGVLPTLFKKGLGFRTCAALLKNKSKAVYNWILACFLKVLSLSFLYEVSKCCCGIFDIWRKLAFELLQQVKNIWPRVPQGMPTSVRVGTPHNFRKTGRNKTIHALNGSSNWRQNGNQHLKVWNTFGYIFLWFPASFLGGISMDF